MGNTGFKMFFFVCLTSIFLFIEIDIYQNNFLEEKNTSPPPSFEVKWSIDHFQTNLDKNSVHA